MGGKRILYALILLALIGMVQADIITYLGQYVYPTSGTQYGSATPTFTCDYFYYLNSTLSRVQGAYVLVMLDGINHTATYSGTGYSFSGATISAGAHNWYCIASAPGYPYKIGPTQTYTVLQQTGGGGGGGGGGRHYMMEPTEQITMGSPWALAVVAIAIIGIVIGYFILREALTVAVAKPRKKTK